MNISTLDKFGYVINVVKLKRLNYDYFDYRICNRLLNWPYGQKI